MKASIITMTRTYNYGATLQAFALQEYIESLGHQCNIVDHMGSDKHKTVDFKDFSVGNILKWPYKTKLEQGYTNFEKFYDEYMHMTHRYPDKASLLQNPPDSDVFVTGSDQVWNPRDLRGEFYLDFAPEGKKRISYAASIGVSEFPDDKKETIKSYIDKMDGISLRENGGVKAVTEITDKTVNKNCDPVFLIDREKWAALESPVKGLEDGFILCYMIYKPEWLNDWLKAIRKKTGKKIVFMGLHGYRPVACDYYVRTAGPREFLWLVNHSSAVATSSFHGAAFSILFGKPFVAMPDPPRPDRLHNLLELFGLQDRIIYENKVENSFNPYDYSNVESIIKREQGKSIEYFTEQFSEV